MDNKQRLKVLFEFYCGMVKDADYDDWTQTKYSEHLKVSRPTLQAWNKKIDWVSVLAGKRQNYAQKIGEVDVSLFKKAKSGDVKAMELAYVRFDGWIPTARTINTNETDDDLKKEADAIRARLYSQQAPGRDLPGTGTASA